MPLGRLWLWAKRLASCNNASQTMTANSLDPERLLLDAVLKASLLAKAGNHLQASLGIDTLAHEDTVGPKFQSSLLRCRFLVSRHSMAP